MKTLQDIEPFAELFEREAREHFAATYAGAYLQERMDCACTVSVKMGKKFARVDIGKDCHCSGRYMVNLETGEIYGIKAYGVVHRGHRYGTLDTVAEWYWGDYRAFRKSPAKPQHAPECNASVGLAQGEICNCFAA